MLEKKKKYHHGDLRTALVVAGLEILEEDGLDGLTLRAVAKRVGVSHTAPKNHFDGVKALWTAIATEGFWLHAKAMRDGVTSGATRDDKLRAAAAGYARFASEHPALFQLMFSPALCEHRDAALGEAASASYAVLREISAGLDWPGAEGPARQERTEWMVWSLVHGYAMLAISAQFPTGESGAPRHDVLSVMPKFGYPD
ncbi:TetR family transcriptional regulator [Rhodobacterales bacterium HKCCE3408]|nr:TetR family transcriptional regulator [Rhodobacterales bacterium HKCCE3408]